jgi:carbonic anhydrase/acetyltransferase-like protein (isoleucine patch superfamily)
MGLSLFERGHRGPSGSGQVLPEVIPGLNTDSKRLRTTVLHAYNGLAPKLGVGVFIAEGAQVIGDVEIGDHSSVWFNTVVRGDIHHIRIGVRTNVQDGSVCHVMRGECPVILGDSVTIGHGVVLHGCTVESHCLVGMNSTLLNNATVGEYSIVAAGALIPEGMVVPPRSLVMGMPARVRRTLTDEEVTSIDAYAERYCEYKNKYLGG